MATRSKVRGRNNHNHQFTTLPLYQTSWQDCKLEPGQICFSFVEEIHWRVFSWPISIGRFLHAKFLQMIKGTRGKIPLIYVGLLYNLDHHYANKEVEISFLAQQFHKVSIFSFAIWKDKTNLVKTQHSRNSTQYINIICLNTQEDVPLLIVNFWRSQMTESFSL